MGDKDQQNCEYKNKNIGELANGILGDLTLVEEELGIARKHGSANHPKDLDDALSNLADAQAKANEILRRHENRVGPI